MYMRENKEQVKRSKFVRGARYSVNLVVDEEGRAWYDFLRSKGVNVSEVMREALERSYNEMGGSS